MVSSAGMRLREKSFKKYQKKRSQSIYILLMRGGALIQPIAMKVCTFVKIINGNNRANFGGCILRGLAATKDRIRLHRSEVDMALTTLPCATALAYDE
jgi:hypothetical protein